MTDAEARVRAAIDAARRVASPDDPIGRRARQELPAATGLSAPVVEQALEACLETRPSDDDVRSLCASVRPAQRSHVLLSSNVFVGAHRAISLALAQSETVFVRASTREPLMAPLLREAGAPFELVEGLEPAPGDCLWVYGSDETIEKVSGGLPPEVELQAHGFGFGIAVLTSSDETSVRDLARDIVTLDQRGCLSPRLAFFVGPPTAARSFAERLAAELARLATELPVGVTSPEERADAVRYRDAARFAGDVFEAGPSLVSVSNAAVLPPPVRNFHVALSEDRARMAKRLRRFAERITSVGAKVDDELAVALRRWLPRARQCALGEMQQPPFDGPVDLRG